jgi:sec-independent protein translocase protein TatA
MGIGPFGIWEILIIAIVLLLLFGARRLPEIGKSTAQSIREFRKAIRNDENDATNGEQPEKPSDPTMSNDTVVTVTSEASKDERQPS